MGKRVAFSVTHTLHPLRSYKALLGCILFSTAMPHWERKVSKCHLLEPVSSSCDSSSTGSALKGFYWMEDGAVRVSGCLNCHGLIGPDRGGTQEEGHRHPSVWSSEQSWTLHHKDVRSRGVERDASVRAARPKGKQLLPATTEGFMAYHTVVGSIQASSWYLIW